MGSVARCAARGVPSRAVTAPKGYRKNRGRQLRGAEADRASARRRGVSRSRRNKLDTDRQVRDASRLAGPVTVRRMEPPIE